MKTYLVLYLTGPFKDQKVRITTPYYHRVGERRSDKDGFYRIIE